jgi:hypothetical protein
MHSITTAAEEQAKSKAAAHRHVIRNMILGEKHIARLSAYERQIMASLRSFYTPRCRPVGGRHCFSASRSMLLAPRTPTCAWL